MTTSEQPFSLLAVTDLSEACFSGCPYVNFQQLEQEVNAARQDVSLAQEAGVSPAGCDLLAERVPKLQDDALLQAAKAPQHGTGPWSVEMTDGRQEPECCRHAGAVILYAQSGAITRIRPSQK